MRAGREFVLAGEQIGVEILLEETVLRQHKRNQLVLLLAVNLLRGARFGRLRGGGSGVQLHRAERQRGRCDTGEVQHLGSHRLVHRLHLVGGDLRLGRVVEENRRQVADNHQVLLVDQLGCQKLAVRRSELAAIALEEQRTHILGELHHDAFHALHQVGGGDLLLGCTLSDTRFVLVGVIRIRAITQPGGISVL